VAAPAAPWERPPEPIVTGGAAFEGLLYLPEPGRIDGRVDGVVLAESTVWIGAEGRVRARVEAAVVVVEGALDGEVRASGKIDLRPSARVTARLATPRLVLAEGSFFEGRCETQIADAGAAPEQPAAPATTAGTS